MLVFKPTVVMVLVGLSTNLLAASVRAESAVRGELSLGMGSASGLVDPEGHSATLSGLLLGISLGLRSGHMVAGGSAESVLESWGTVNPLSPLMLADLSEARRGD